MPPVPPQPRRSGRQRPPISYASLIEPGNNNKPPKAKRARKNFGPVPDRKPSPNKLDDNIPPSTIIGMSHVIALEIVGKPEVRHTFSITTQKLKIDYPRHPNFPNLVMAVQKVLDLMLQTSRANKSGNPASVNNRSLSGVIDLKNITNVYVYLARKMGDLIHDLQSVALLKEKLKIVNTTDIVETFKKYLETVKWLNPEIRRLIKSASPEEKAIFEQVHGALSESVGGANKISESTMNKLFAGILMQGKTTPLPYITTDITNIESIKTVQPVPSIVFDQTSKGTGPNLYGQIIQMFPNQIVKQNLGLATLSDFAGSLPSSPERGYMFDMMEIISNFFTVRKETVWNKLNKYSLNVSPVFTSQVIMGDVEVQSTRLMIDGNNKLRRHLILDSKVVDNGVPLSADGIKASNITVTDCEHKTGLDFDLIVYAKSIGAIHSTGDVSACGFNQDLAIMGVKNNFVNETTSMSVTVSIGSGKIRTKAPMSMPVAVPPDSFVVQMLQNVFGPYGFTPANIQKLSNAFRVGNAVSNAKRQYLINKVQNGNIQPGIIKSIVNSSRNANALRSELERRRLFTNVPSSSGGPVEEESLENKTTLNKFRNSLKKKGVNNNAYINRLYTTLNSNMSRFQIMNSNNQMLITSLKGGVLNKTQINEYLQLLANNYARSRAKQQVVSNPTNINEFIDKFPQIKQGYKASEERVRTDIRKLIKTNIERGKKNNGGIERHVLDYINFNKEVQRVANQSVVRNQYRALTPEDKLILYLQIGGEFSILRYSMNENTPEGNINNKRKEILRRYIIKGS